MSYDPIDGIIDEPLSANAAVFDALREFRDATKLDSLPGINTRAERERLSAIVNQLVDRIADGLATNPQKLWVMRQFQRSLAAVQHEDTEAREHFGIELERLMDILGIDSSDGLLNHYLVGI